MSTEGAKAIVSTRDTIGGAWRFDGTRIPVDIIAQQIDHVSVKPEDIPHYYPSLTVADAYAALEWVGAFDELVAATEALAHRLDGEK